MQHEDNNIDNLFQKRLGNKEMKVSNLHFPSEQKSKAKAPSSDASSLHFTSFKSLVKAISLGGSVILIVTAYILLNNNKNTKDNTNSDSIDSLLIEENTFKEDSIQINKNDSLKNATNKKEHSLSQPVTHKKQILNQITNEPVIEKKSLLKTNKKSFVSHDDSLCVKDTSMDKNTESTIQTTPAPILSKQISQKKQTVDKTRVNDSTETAEPETIPEQVIPSDSASDKKSDTPIQGKKDKKRKNKKNRTVKKLR